MNLLRAIISGAWFLTQSVLLALGQIWTNKTRSVLTTTGIVIGVAAVTAVIAALSGLRANILSEFESLGTNKLYISPRWPETGRHRHASWQIIRFRPEQFEGLTEHCPSVAYMTLVCQAGAKVSRGDRSIENANISGIDPDWHAVENRSVEVGRPFSMIDAQRATQVCLVNADAREKLRLDRDPTGESIYIGNRRFLIVGVVEKRVESGMFGGQDAGVEIFVPFDTLWNIYQPWVWAIASARSPELSDDARAELRFYLRQRRNLRPDDPDTFRIEVIEQYLQQFNRMAVAVTMVAGGIVGVSLLVGGIGIMNIMLVSVSERTREIGLRKAVGARPAAILFQFLIEAVTLCSIGGLVGLVGGHALTLLMAAMPGAQLDRAFIPLWAAGVSIGFAAMVGVFFGMFPAFKAARLDPIEALRHE